MPFGGLLTVGLISAGAGLAGAAIQSHQTGKAVDAQKDASEQALALQKDIYNQQVANLSPWRNTGAAAITTLGGLLGLPGGGGSGQLPASGTAPAMDAPISPGQANFAGYSPYGGYVGKNVTMGERMSNPNATVDAAGYTAQQHGASLPSASSYGTPAMQTGAPMLRGQTPTGQMVQVPAEKAGEFQQNGGTILGQA